MDQILLFLFTLFFHVAHALLNGTWHQQIDKFFPDGFWSLSPLSTFLVPFFPYFLGRTISYEALISFPVHFSPRTEVLLGLSIPALGPSFNLFDQVTKIDKSFRTPPSHNARALPVNHVGVVKATIRRPTSFFFTPTIAHPFVHHSDHGIPRAMVNVLSNTVLPS
ncbi:hypothetical protein B0H11DRAFT_2076124 [Mycena galericulata]|nr:hypothetical protein B0H11DRAFT_2076124 [Mycena galericulata]